MASDPAVVSARAVPVQTAPAPVAPWRRAFRTGVITVIAAAITPFIVPVPHARAALRRWREAIERARRKEPRVSLGPLAIVLLLPVSLVVGLRTHRWTRVVVAGIGAALAALIFPTAAVVIVVAAVLALIAGAVLLGTGAHAVGRPGGTLSVAELVVGGLAIRWWRRRQARRWSESWTRRARQLKL